MISSSPSFLQWSSFEVEKTQIHINKWLSENKVKKEMRRKVKSCGTSYVFVHPMLISHTGTLVTHRQTGSPLSSNFSFSFYVCVCVRWWCLQVGDGSTLIDHQARDLQMMMEMTWWLRMRWWMAFISRLTNRQWLHRWLRPILLWISDEG